MITTLMGYNAIWIWGNFFRILKKPKHDFLCCDNIHYVTHLSIINNSMTDKTMTHNSMFKTGLMCGWSNRLVSDDRFSEFVGLAYSFYVIRLPYSLTINIRKSLFSFLIEGNMFPIFKKFTELLVNWKKKKKKKQVENYLT